MALAIDCAAQKGIADGKHAGPPLGADFGAGAQHHGIAEQHQQTASAAKADHFGGERGIAAVFDLAQRADRSR